MDNPSKTFIVSLEERRKLIAAHPFFAPLSAKDIDELANLLRDKVVVAGEVIVTEGNFVDAIYLIAKGDAEVRRDATTSGKTSIVPIAVLHSGESIGLSDVGFFSKDGKRTATVIANTDMILLKISLESFEAFIGKLHQLYPDVHVAAENMLRINFIKSIEPFAPLDIRELNILAKRVDEVKVAAGTTIFIQGEIGTKCYFIKSGRVDISIRTERGVAELAALSSPAIFGEMAVLTKSLRNATAKAETDCVLLTLDGKYLTEFLYHKHSAAMLQEIIFKRSRPAPVEGLKVYEQVTFDGEPLVILKSDDNRHYMRLHKEKWFIWQLVDGKRTVENIVAEYIKKFDKAERASKVVMSFLFDLADDDFITGMGFRGPSLIKRIILFIKETL
jgi:CRP-like cAMP-binding protein